MPKPDSMVPLPVASQQLGLPYNTAYRLVLIGDLKATRIGSRILVHQSSVDLVREGRKARAAQPSE